MFTSLPAWDTGGFAYCRVYWIYKADLAVENAINVCNSLDLMEENPSGGSGGEFSIPKMPNELIISGSTESLQPLAALLGCQQYSLPRAPLLEMVNC